MDLQLVARQKDIVTWYFYVSTLLDWLPNISWVTTISEHSRTTDLCLLMWQEQINGISPIPGRCVTTDGSKDRHGGPKPLHCE